MQRILNSIGFGLLALCFIISVGRIAWMRMSRTAEDGSEIVQIRLAHWQLEGGVREALDEMARLYMEQNPGVFIRQIPIPERIYRNWLLTQLVGGTAPDIIQVGIGITPERLARFFIPLTDLAEAPNPYNEGTELEGMLLRDTFFDGMMGGFNMELLEYFGVPLSAHTIRVYINMDLLREITGSDQLPKTYREFIELCDQARAFGEENHRTVIPVAGSRYNSPFLMNNLFASQTQKLLQELTPPGVFEMSSNRLAETYVDEKWTLDDPEIRSGLRIMREVGGKMQPGFMQVMRDDATFYFMQGRALMIATGSWDSSSIHQQAKFPFRAFRIPLPSRDDPEYGEFVRGFTSEAGVNAGLSLGVTNISKHPEVAMDFLLFLASQPMNQVFTNISGWIPSVVGVQPSEVARDFMILTDGFTNGFTLNQGNTPDVNRVVNNAFHRLVAPEGSVDEFIQIVRPNLVRAQASDLARNAMNTQAGLRQMDVQIAGVAGVVKDQPDDELSQRRLDLILSSINQQERRARNLQFVEEKVRKYLRNGPVSARNEAN
jgi:raffinose/stachyose/melibiose transport system substrate-binding protein